MRKEEIIELDCAKVYRSIIEELQHSEHVDYLIYWCDGECDAVLKDGTYVTVHVGGVKV